MKISPDPANDGANYLLDPDIHHRAASELITFTTSGPGRRQDVFNDVYRALFRGTQDNYIYRVGTAVYGERSPTPLIGHVVVRVLDRSQPPVRPSLLLQHELHPDGTVRQQPVMSTGPQPPPESLAGAIEILERFGYVEPETAGGLARVEEIALDNLHAIRLATALREITDYGRLCF
jgi:hypothetical protein